MLASVSSTYALLHPDAASLQQQQEQQSRHQQQQQYARNVPGISKLLAAISAACAHADNLGAVKCAD